MKATLNAKYESEKQYPGATFTISGVPVGPDLRLKASVTDAAFVKGPSLQSLSLSTEKPDSFTVDYDATKQDVKFQFKSSVNLMEKPVSLTYTHSLKERKTTVDAALTLYSASKVSVAYGLGATDCKVKYVYTHGEQGRTVLEPCYDVYKKAWDLAVTQKLEGGNSMKATYDTSSKKLGLEWNRESMFNGAFKIAASVDLAGHQKLKSLTAESTLNYEI